MNRPSRAIALRRTRPTLAAAALAALVMADRAIAAPPAAATWDGGGGLAGNDWFNANNWVGDVLPVSGTTTTITFAGTTSLAPQQDIANPYVLNTLVFSPAAGAFTLGGSGLAFNGASATIAQGAASTMTVNNSLMLNAPLTLAGTGSGGLTLGGAISGSVGLTATGAYTTTLSASNTYAGGTTVTGGTLAVTSTGSIGTAGGTLSFGGTAATVTLAGNANGSGGRIVSAGAEVYGNNPADTAGPFYATVTQAGGTHTAAEIEMGLGHNIHSTYNLQAGVLTVAGAVQVSYAASGSASEFNQTGGTFTAGSVVMTSLGEYDLSGGILATGSVAAYGSTLNLNGGTLRATADDASATSPFLAISGQSVYVQAGGAVVDTNGHGITFGGPLLHGTAAATDGGLTKVGAGTLVLTGVNTYTGATSVNAGTLELASGSQTVSDLILGTATSSAAYNLAGGTLTLGTTSRGLGGAPFTFNGGMLRPMADNATPLAGVTSVSVANGGATIDTNAFNMSVGQPLVAAGTGGLTKAGAGTLTLSGSSTYTGGTSVTAGTLAVASTGSIGTAGGTLSLGSVMAGTYATGTVTLAGNADGTGGRVASAGTEAFGHDGLGGGSFNQAGGTHTAGGIQMGYGEAVASTYTLSAGVLTVSGPITMGSGAAASSAQFTQTGGTATAGSLSMLTNTSAYTLSGGTLAVGSVAGTYAGAYPTLNFGGGTLRATADDGAVPFLSTFNSSSGVTVNVLAGGATVDTNGHSISFGSPLLHGTATGTADGGLTKVGTGSLTLRTANTYTGPTNVNGGTLVLAYPYDGTNGTLNASSSITVNSGGTLQLGITANGNNVIIATGTTIIPLTVAAGGTVTTFAGTTHNLGAVTLTGGTLAGSASPLSGFGDYTLNAAGAVTANGPTDSAITAPGGVGLRGTVSFTVGTGGGRLLVSAPLRDESGATGGLTKLGTSTMVLSAAESYTGLTTVNAGTLQLTPTASLAGSSTVVSNATLELTAANAGSGISVRSISGLTLKLGGLARVDAPPAPTARQLLVASGLTFAGSPGNLQGTLDLTGNDLDVPGGTLATITAAVKQGFAGGSWNGSAGIISTSAASDAHHLTAVGVISDAVAGYASFDGQATSTTDVLARYTYYGDTNLDGAVTAADYTRLDAGYIGHLTGWANGDFNYDGTVDGSDYTLTDNAFNRQNGSIGSPSTAVATATFAVMTTAVPEPASLGTVALALAASLRGKRRRRPSAFFPRCRTPRPS